MSKQNKKEIRDVSAGNGGFFRDPKEQETAKYWKKFQTQHGKAWQDRNRQTPNAGKRKVAEKELSRLAPRRRAPLG